jgi:hypothetical protein
MTGGTATPNLICFFEWRGGTGIVADCEIPDISSGWWGNKSEINCQMQMLQRAGGPCGMFGKNTNYYAAKWTGNVPSSPGAYPAPRQIGMSHPSSGNVTTDVTNNRCTFYNTTTAYTVPSGPNAGAVLTGMDTNTNNCYLGNLSPMYAWNNTGTGNYTSIYGGNYQTSGTFEDGDTVFAHFADGNDYFYPGRDWINSAKPGYTKYAYPHPLRTN